MRGHRISFVSAAGMFFYLLAGMASFAAGQNFSWKDADRGIWDSDIMRVVVNPGKPDIAYASSQKAVYVSSDAGDTWQEILSLRGTGKTVHALAADAKTVFAGTSDGLFRSGDSGSHWEKIFSGIGGLEGLVSCIDVNIQNPDEIIIGTGSGTYRTQNNGKDWVRGQNMSLGTLVTSVAIDNKEPQTVYASAERGLFKSSDHGLTWERIFVSGMPETPDSILHEDHMQTSDETGTGLRVASVLVDPSDNRHLYMGTSSGLFISADRGLTWNKAGGSGLLSRDIRHLSMSSKQPDSIFAATDRGVFRYERSAERWSRVSNGLVSSDIRYLSVSDDVQSGSVTLWAATDKGIFKTVGQSEIYSRIHDATAQQVLSQFDHEPTIGEIRNAAIEYAEVQPEKIRNWRKAAAKRALLPDVRFEYQKNKSWQKGTYFYSNATEKYTDDDFTHDRDKDWSISLSWDLGELVWNDDQTSIDSRSKLMVELRDDIVNEVTRLYFERRKVQIEMLLQQDGSFKQRMDRELRLQELTAGIDALTGSFLSERLAKKGEERVKSHE